MTYNSQTKHKIKSLKSLEEEIKIATKELNNKLKTLNAHRWKEDETPPRFTEAAMALCKVCSLHDTHIEIYNKPHESFNDIVDWLKKVTEPPLRRALGPLIS